MAKKKRTVSETKQTFTIYDNLARHEKELIAIGATESDLLPLRQAAKAVAVEEEKQELELQKNPATEGIALEDLAEPYEACNGWKIPFPTIAAKKWATMSMIKVTGGLEPDSALGTRMALAVGLYVLWSWGQGKKDHVMQLVAGPGNVAESLPTLLDHFEQASSDDMASDWMLLCGISKKKQALLMKYQTLREQIQRKCRRSLTDKPSATLSPSGEPE